jgi:hypothetical protein
MYKRQERNQVKPTLYKFCSSTFLVAVGFVLNQYQSSTWSRIQVTRRDNKRFSIFSELQVMAKEQYLAGKLAIVTGAGKPNGIGAAAAYALAEHGANVSYWGDGVIARQMLNQNWPNRSWFTMGEAARRRRRLLRKLKL